MALLSLRQLHSSVLIAGAFLGATAREDAAFAGPVPGNVPELVLQFGHDQEVTAMALSPDGAMLASASGGADATVKFWDTRTGDLRATRDVQGGQIYALAFAPDGRTLASGDELGRVILWDAQAGTRKRTLRLTPDINQVFSVAWSPDGRSLAAGGVEGTVKIWDASTGTLRRTWTTRLGGRAAKAFSVAWSRDGRTLATALGKGDEDIPRRPGKPGPPMPPTPGGMIALWGAQTGQRTRVLAVTTQDQQSVSFSPDGRLIAASGSDQIIRVWNAKTGSPVRTWNTGQSLLEAVAFTPDSKTLTSMAYAGSLKSWDANTGVLKATLFRNALSAGANAFAYAPQGEILAAGLNTGDIQLRDAHTGAMRRVLAGYRRPEVHAIAFSPDGRTLADGVFRLEGKTPSGDVLLWDTRTGALRQTLTRPSGAAKAGYFSLEDDVLAMAFSPGGATLAVASTLDIKIWDIASGQWRRTLALPETAMLAPNVAYSPDGTTVVAGSTEGRMLFWDSTTGQIKHTFSLGNDVVLTASALSPEGNTLAASIARRAGNTIEWELALWDVHAGRRKQVLRTVTTKRLFPEAFLNPVLYSPSGKWLVSGSIGHFLDPHHPLSASGGGLKIWDAQTGRLLRTLKDVPALVAFSPDNRTLATATGTLWNVQTGAVRQRLSGLRVPPNGSMAFSPNAKVIAVGSEDGTITIWDAAGGRLLATLFLLPQEQDAHVPEWLVVTPGGYYDGSRGAEKFIRWRVGTHLYPAATYASVYDRPDKVRQALRGGHARERR